MISEISANTYRVDSVDDLSAVAATNLYNTGDPNDRYSTTHNGASTVYIPQSSIFSDTYAGKKIDAGSFLGVQAMMQGQHSSFFEAGRTYTVGELMQISEFQNQGYWNVSIEHGAYGIGQENYTNYAYVYGTQNFVLDQSTEIIVDNAGNIKLESYHIRLNKMTGASHPSDDFDFEGGGLGSQIFNYVHSSDIDLGGETVTLIYEGDGLKGSNYNFNDLANYLNNGGLQGASNAQKFLAWRLNIIPDPESSGIIVNGKDAVILVAVDAYLAANLQEDPGFLERNGILEEIVDLVGVENAAELLVKYNSSCFCNGTQVSMRNGDTKRIEEVRSGDQVVSFDKNNDPIFGLVLGVKLNTTDEWLKLSFADNRGPIHVTPGHRFLTETGDYMEIGHMVRLGGGAATVVMQDGSLQTVQAERITYSAETAHLLEIGVFADATKTCPHSGLPFGQKRMNQMRH